MKKEKHLQGIKETLDEIEAALEDPKGLQHHRIRLALMLSTGCAELLELYLHRNGIMKPGGRIKHNWLNRSKERILEKVKNQITGDLEKINILSKIIKSCKTIESKRNDLAYGSPLEDEEELQKLIDIFLNIKEMIEEETGEEIE